MNTLLITPVNEFNIKKCILFPHTIDNFFENGYKKYSKFISLRRM